ncbi:MAG TPA: SemiSWEET transporter [Niabella sp.]|nr:SemiSWEET transporter [Niabella sp.]
MPTVFNSRLGRQSLKVRASGLFVICCSDGIDIVFLMLTIIDYQPVNAQTIIGVAASVCTAVSLFPQLVKIIREKKESDISYWMLAILIAGLALWVWYGFIDEDYIIIVSNSVSLLINISVLILNIYYRRQHRS